jgi:DoxX-like family
MINRTKNYLLITAQLFIVLVWFVNGLWCKVLGFVPRHREIVGQLLGSAYATEITKAIGLAELLMVVWILSRIYPRVCAMMQIGVVLLMNTIEFIAVPELLLFGRLNMVLAILFSGLVYWTMLAEANQKFPKV